VTTVSYHRRELNNATGLVVRDCNESGCLLECGDFAVWLPWSAMDDLRELEDYWTYDGPE
jgi:hypothetical protein